MRSRSHTRRRRFCPPSSLESLEPRRVLDGTVVFNEVMYNPVGEESHEWIELYNQMSVDVELSNWTIEGGVDYQFPAGTLLGGGEYLVVAADPQHVAEQTGLQNVLGPFRGRLSNAGERIELRNHTQRLMNTLNYRDGDIDDDIWPAGADGTGATLAKIRHGDATEDPTNWAASEHLGGTPGAQNVFMVGSLRRDFFVSFDDEWNFNQSGQQPPENWRDADFDDSTWEQGRGLLYVENGALPAEKNTELTLGATTYYFRKTFDYQGEPSDGQLRLNHAVDDGAIFYLNGQEIERYRMPDGPVDASTLASRPVATARTVLSDQIDGSLLRPGLNTLAVEVHQQSVGSDDVVFGTEFWLDTEVVSPEIPIAEINLSEVGTNADFWVEIHNPSDVPVPIEDWVLGDSQGQRFTIPNQTLSPGERIVITESDSGLQPDAGDRVFLLGPQDRLIDTVRVGDHVRGRAAAWDGRWQAVSEPTPGEPNSFAMHDDVVINEIMYNFLPQYAEPPVFEHVVFVPFDAEWRYQVGSADLGAEFANPDFDDSAWDVGRGTFFREDSELLWTKNTELPIGEVTTYFRHEFEISDLDAAYGIQHLVDDAAAIYLNGQEIARLNLPGGPLTNATLATESVGNASITGPLEIPAELLKAGINTLAVELHQNSPFSPDAVFGLQIVQINETKPAIDFQRSDEEWIELYNRSQNPIDISGWQLSDAVDFVVPPDSVLGAGEYVVVAKAADDLATKYPDLRILGEYQGSLSNFSERIQLLDATGNLADEVEYFEGGYWPRFADGGGASLELTDPDADNSKAGAWAQSIETDRTAWQHVSYTSTIQPIVHDPPIHFHELVMGLLDTGVILVDNISVKELAATGPIELIQNGDFEGDAVGSPAEKWRAVGTHNRSQVVSDPDDANNHVLRVDAIARINYLSNHIETTLANGAVVENGKTYEISYDARWVAGSPQFHTELYYKDAARTTILDLPQHVGTPGAKNSVIDGAVADANVGPTFDGLQHTPIVPDEGESVTISVQAGDNDGIQRIQTMYRVDRVDDQFTAVEMDLGLDGVYRATLPAQEDEALVQFYVEAEDAHGAITQYPPAGPDSRALYRVYTSAPFDLDRHVFDVLTLREDAERLHTPIYMIDNQHLGATVVHDGQDVFYDAGVRLRGSMFSRQSTSGTGFNVKFRPETLFRGVHESIAFDQGNELEVVVKVINLQSGNGGGTYDDVFNLVTPLRVGGGPTLVYLARHSDLYLEEQFGPDPGTLFKFEGIRVLTTPSDRDDPESLKLYQPIGWVPSFDIEDLGDDKELYRWPFLINGNRARDDYSGIIRMAKAFSAPEDELEQAVSEALDMDAWTKTFALMSVFGIGDAYTQGNPHNLNLFVPSNGDPIKAFPWDWDFVFNRGPTSPLHGNRNFGKILEIPTFRHLLMGHMNHLFNTVFNREYMEHWTTHLGNMLQSSYANMLTNADRRTNFIRGEFPIRFPFVATTGDVSILEEKLLTEDNPATYLIPTRQNGGDELGDAWLEKDFVESESWQDGFAALGFQPASRTDFGEFIKTPIPEMRGTNASVFIRVPFELNREINENSAVHLRMRYDDGFVASLNGVRVAAVNEPDEITWDADASGSHSNAEAVELQTFDITDFKHLLVPGSNLLAIQGMNTSISSSDALFGAEIVIVDLEVDESSTSNVLDADAAEINGVGWVDLHSIRLKGEDEPLPLRWISDTEWRTSVPLELGENRIEIEAYGFDGQMIATQVLDVTSTTSRPVNDFLRISEVMYHPTEPSSTEVSAGFDSDADFEFIELVNTSQGDDSVTLSLDGVQLSGGVDYVLPDVQLGAGERIVVAANPTALESRYGDIGTVVGPFEGSLSNAGERLELADADGLPIVNMEYADSGLWPVRADGIGASLVARDPATSSGKHHQWRGSTRFGGTPGAAELPEIGVVINEVIARTSTPESDQIELLNRTSTSVDLSGWMLSDRAADWARYTLPNNSILGPGEYLVLNEAQFGFGLGSNGDSVWLTVPDSEGQPVAFADDVHFGGSRLGESLGRLPDGHGFLAPLSEPTFGNANVDSRSARIVISEVHYHPADPSAATNVDPEMTEDQLEFIELTNVSDVTVDLGNWRLRGGVEMNFDANTELAPGEAIVVTSFNPDNSTRLNAFRAEFGVSDEIQIVGGFGGGLNNGADQIRLLSVDTNDGDLIRPLEDELVYDDEAPWPTSADGLGSSLTRSNPNRWGTLRNAWAAALPNPGVPASTTLAGDITGDGLVDAADVDQLCANLRAGNADPANDLNGDGVFTDSDLDHLVEDILGTSAGDADLNGRFDSEDIVAVFIAGQYDDGIDGNSNWATGDWNCDGDFDSEDLVAAFVSGRYEGR